MSINDVANDGTGRVGAACTEDWVEIEGNIFDIVNIIINLYCNARV